MEEKKVRVEKWNAEEVAEQAARGDAEALGVLYKQFDNLVRRIALTVVRNPHDAEDVAQTVWVKLMHGIKHYSPEARFTTWLYRVVTHAAIDHVRKRTRDAEYPDTGAGTDEADALHGSTSRSYALEQELAYLRDRIAVEIGRAARALAESNQTRGRCFQMYYLGEMTIRDISDALRLSEGTVKSHLFYCRRYISDHHPVLEELHLALEERLGKDNGNRVY